MALVTVCIPAYRSEQWLATGLESVRRQTIPDLQVLVGIEPVDPEPTIRICREFASDPRFGYHVNPIRLGWGTNLRTLLERVETPYFLILFHDDWLHKRYLETLLPPLLERPELSVCYGDIRRTGSGGRKCLPLPDGSRFEQLRELFLGRADGLPVRGVTRSSVLEEAAFPTNEYDDFAVECEWALHLLVRGRALHVHRPLYLKRMFPEDEPVSVTGGWRLRMPVDELRAALVHHREQLLEGARRADLTADERRPVMLTAEAAALHRYVQYARGRFRLDAEQRERARRIREEAGSVLDPYSAARLRWILDWAESADAGNPVGKFRPRHKRRIAVIGAGIQGVATSLELADRGYGVTLLERRREPLGAASRWNEGKVHLGYLWVRDPSLRTARRLLDGSLCFAQGIERLIGTPIPDEWLSEPFVYGVPRSSLLGAEELARHFGAIDGLIDAELSRDGGDYFGRRELPRTRAVEVEEHFDPATVSDAFRTPERSVDPHRVADALSERMKTHPDISFTGKMAVSRVTRRNGSGFDLWGRKRRLGGFDAVVNAAGGSRLALDHSVGIDPPTKWIHRYKLAARVRAPGVAPPSATLVHGPFGDVVRFEGDLLYISWYPVCRIAMSQELEIPDLGRRLSREERIEIAQTSWDELASFLPALRDRRPDWRRARVGGGHIPAWGTTDVDDPASGLHSRFQNGVFSTGGYHSVDPGKYGMAPLYAQVVADRIDGGGWRR